MEKLSNPNTIVTAEPTFFVRTDFTGITIKAASWDEAKIRAAEYMAESYYGANEHGTQRIRYTVYLLPAGTHIWSEDYVSPEVLERCESQDATHVEEREA